MIYTDLNNLERYLGMRKHLDTAIHYIKEHSLNDLKKGCNEVDGDFAFINCFEYETLPEEKTFFEAHEKYADIHMVISGEEKMGVSDMSLMTVTAKDEETDSIECHGPVEHYMDLTPGKVLIVFPEDAHKVKIMKDQVTQVRKAIGKVLVTE